MTKKKADKQDKRHFESHSESTELSPDHPRDIRRKRRLAYLQAVCLMRYLEEQGKLAARLFD
jgi:hypothetical protein